MAIEGPSGSGFDDQFWPTDAVNPGIFWESPHPLSIVGVTYPSLATPCPPRRADSLQPPIRRLSIRAPRRAAREGALGSSDRSPNPLDRRRLVRGPGMPSGALPRP